jgi:cytochrome c oxidase subunit 2
MNDLLAGLGRALEPLDNLMRKMLFLPERASTFAADIDHMHYFIITMTMITSTGIAVAALLLYAQYRRRPGHRLAEAVHPPLWFEVSILVVPLAFFLLWFFMGFQGFVRMNTPPADAMDIVVTGKKWMWKFAYADGPNSINVIRVPAHRNVRLLMTSRDVIHSFYVPELRVKEDVLPGRTTQLWFNATVPGRYEILCAEYCGTGHSVMRGTLDVMEPVEFDEWMQSQRAGLASRQDMGGALNPEEATNGTLVEQGRLAAVQHACFRCHSIDGSAHIGPTWLGLYHRNERLSDGREIFVDEGYLTRSMMDPMADIVAGYSPQMPTFQGRLTAPEAAAIVEYIKSLQDDRLAQQKTPGPVYEPTFKR